ncbi:MAG TPA: sugar ABC transporter substrate-binding protein [Actinomycetota bacterium]
MRRMRRMVLLLAAMTLVASACSGKTASTPSEGGGGTNAEPVTLNFWVFDEIETGSFYDTLVGAFEAKHPNIHVELTSYPEDNYDVKLSTAIAAGKEPDLILSFGPDFPRQGLLLPLDDMVASHGIDLSHFSQAIVGEGGEFSCGWEDHLYCLGSYQGVSAMLYNKTMFDAAGIPYPAAWPPMTPDEFVDIACRLTDEAHQIWGGAAADPMSYLPWETYVSPDGRTATGYVNGPGTVHAFEVLADGFEQGCFPSLNIIDPWAQGRDFFAKGQLGMVVTDYLGLNKVENAGIDYGSTAPPTPAGLEPYFFSWSDSVGVMSSSEHPDEAIEFVAFLATDGQRIRFENSGDIPLDTTVAQEVDWAQGIPGRTDGLEVASHARSAILIPNRWDVFGPLWDAWGYILGGDKSVQQALDDVTPAIQENLDKAWRDWEEQV